MKAEETDCDEGPILNRARKLPSSLNTSDTNFQSLNTKLQSTSLSLARRNTTHAMVKQMRIEGCETLEVVLDEDVEGRMRTSRDVRARASMANGQT